MTEEQSNRVWKQIQKKLAVSDATIRTETWAAAETFKNNEHKRLN